MHFFVYSFSHRFQKLPWRKTILALMFHAGQALAILQFSYYWNYSLLEGWSILSCTNLYSIFSFHCSELKLKKEVSKSNGEVVGVSRKRSLQQYKMDTPEVPPEDDDEVYVSITLLRQGFKTFFLFFYKCYPELCTYWIIPNCWHLTDISSHFVDICLFDLYGIEPQVCKSFGITPNCTGFWGMTC